MLTKNIPTHSAKATDACRQALPEMGKSQGGFPLNRASGSVVSGRPAETPRNRLPSRYVLIREGRFLPTNRAWAPASSYGGLGATAANRYTSGVLSGGVARATAGVSGTPTTHGRTTMEIIFALGTVLGVGFVSGINCYATVFAIGLMGQMGYMDLAQPFDVLASWPIIITSGLMYSGEFFADKIPAFDSAWDGIHTFIRPIVGAAAAAGASGQIGQADPEMMVIAALLGGTVSMTSHLTKAATRLVINMSPEPVSNSVASVAEDGIAFAGVGLSVFLPVVMLMFVGSFLIGFIIFAPKVFRKAKRMLGFGKQPEPEVDTDPTLPTPVA